MNSQWRDFLIGQGAVLDGARVSAFAAAQNSASTENTFIADLSHEGQIVVSGVDAVTFLQGQLSTDTLELNAATSQFSSWNNAKGRVISLLRLWQRDDILYLNLPQALLPTVQKRLSMYVLRAKVTLTEASDRFASFGLAGKDADALLAKAGLPVPRETNGVSRQDHAQVIRLHGDTPRYAIYGSAEPLAALWQALATTGAKPAGEDDWRLSKILAGEPTVYPDTSERFVAQMLGLEELDAIDFKKGCYTGQEVIARAHYRGAVKRHMLRAESRSTESIRPGAPVTLLGSEQAVADVVDAGRDTAGMTQLLLVVQDDHRDAKLSLADGSLVSLLD